MWLLLDLGTVPESVLDPWTGLGVALLLIAVNGFFVAAEFALAKVRPTQLDPAVKRGDRSAKLATRIVANLEGYLPATQLGVTLASIGLGWVGEPAIAGLIRPLAERIPGV